MQGYDMKLCLRRERELQERFAALTSLAYILELFVLVHC